MTSLVSGCIVLYKNDRSILKRAIHSVLHTSSIYKLFLVDNSPDDSLSDLYPDERISYIHNPANPGFGTSHNVAIAEALKLNMKYHFIINPDIYFYHDVISPMVNYMRDHSDVGMMMPKIVYPDGSIQYLPKLLPSPFWILRRKFKAPSNSFSKFINTYELRNLSQNTIYNAPILSGCFTLLNLDAIKEVGVYDDAYFMYFEDFDLSRRMHEKFKTLYFPNVSVYHEYEGGANKSLKLFRVFLCSAVYYFNKWGWFFDRKRVMINSEALNQI